MAGVDGKVIRLTDDQKKAFDDLVKKPFRHVLIFGGSRSGKTFFFVWCIVIRAIKYPGSRHLIYRLRFKDAINSIWLETLPKVIGLMGITAHVKTNAQRCVMTFPNGSEIWTAGVDDARFTDSVLGKEYATVYANEASQIPYATILKVRTRLAQKIEGCAAREFVDLNPVGVGHWTFKEFVEGIDPISSQPGSPVSIANHSRYAHMQMNPQGNLKNLDQYYLESLESMPESMRKRFYLGEYARDNDLVVFHPPALAFYTGDMWEEWAAKERINIRFSAGLDIGFEDADAFCIIAWHPGQRTRWLLYEYKMRRTGLAELAKAVKSGCDWLTSECQRLAIPQQTLSIWSDTGGGGAKMVYDLKREYGLPVRPAYKRDKLSSIELLQDEVKSGLFRIPAGGSFASECDAIVWKKDPDSDVIVREIDDSSYHPDIMDSVLYAMRSVWYSQKIQTR